MDFSYISDPRKRLIIILALTAIHSFFVGIGLIIQLPTIMDMFGFGNIEQPFFPTQGGVFHILMALAYILASMKPENNSTLIKFIIAVKIAATVFLFIYFICVQDIWMLLLSGISDGILALLILTAYRSFLKS